MTKLKKPLIGITADSSKGSNEGYSKYPYYVLREFYSSAVAESGGIPMVIPHDVMAVGEYALLLDGLLITGGDFDVDPKYYGQDIKSDKVKVNEQRTAFEYALLKEIFPLDKPILGICGGHQLINVFLGGTLIQHIPDSIANCIEHEQKTSKHLPSHSVRVYENTLLHRMLGVTSFEVNSTHHQAIDRLGDKLIISASSEDGVIEAMEHASHKFCLGVQWHPEFLTTSEDKKIFFEFINKTQ